MKNLKCLKISSVHIILFLLLIIFLFVFDEAYFVNQISGISMPLNIDINDMESDKIKIGIDFIEEGQLEWEKVLKITGWGFLKGNNSMGDKKFIMLISDDSKYFFETFDVARPDITNIFGDGIFNLETAGFTANIPEELIPDGVYSVGIYLKSGDQEGYVRTQKHISKFKNRFSLD